MMSKHLFGICYCLLCLLYSEASESYHNCGYRGEEIVANGQEPWLVAFIDSSESQLIGTGSLITSRHVLSGEGNDR